MDGVKSRIVVFAMMNLFVKCQRVSFSSYVMYFRATDVVGIIF